MLNVIFTITFAITPTAISFISSQILDTLVSQIGNIQSTSIIDILRPFAEPLSLFILAIAVNIILTHLQRLVSARITVIHLERFRNEFYSKMSELDVKAFEDQELADLFHKAENQIWKISNFVNDVTEVLSLLSTILITGFVLGYLSPFFLIFVTITTIPQLISYGKYSSDFWNTYNRMIKDYRIRTSFRWHLSTPGFIPENRINGARELLNNLLGKVTTQISSEDMKDRVKRFYRDMLSTVAILVRHIFSISFLVIEGVQGRLSIGQFSFYFSRTDAYTGNVGSFLGSLIDLKDSTISLRDIKQVFEFKNEVLPGSRRVSITKPPKIEFRNVSFKYPKSKEYAIRDLNMTINPGEEIAVVGENGSGKSTFIKLLLRFYDPTSGEILINNKSIKTMDLKNYYKLIGAVFQDFSIYSSFKIDQNIAVSERVNKKKLIDAAKKSQSYKDIMSFPNKFDHYMNKIFDRGIEVSKGQKQKIALARVFYKDAPILVLDEPTSSIDAMAEYEIFNRIYKFTNNKTVIIISHRFSTVRNAGRIYVFDKGKIVEQGTHEELLKIDGRYAKSFKLQAEGYSN